MNKYMLTVYTVYTDTDLGRTYNLGRNETLDSAKIQALHVLRVHESETQLSHWAYEGDGTFLNYKTYGKAVLSVVVQD